MEDITLYDFIAYLEQSNQLQDDLTISALTLNTYARRLREYKYKFDVTLDMLRFVARDIPKKLIINDHTSITIKSSKSNKLNIWYSKEDQIARIEINKILDKVWNTVNMNELDAQYKVIVIKYCVAFAEKHNLKFHIDEQDCNWLYNGSVLMSGYFINLSDIIYDVDHVVDSITYETWYSNVQDCAKLNIKYPNYIEYVEGKSSEKDEKIKQFKERFKHIEELKESLEKDIIEFNNGPNIKNDAGIN